MKRAACSVQRAADIIVALDVDSHQKAIRWARLLYPTVKIFKVGLQLYTVAGPRIIRDIRKIGAQVFLDLKFNDIPHTMVSAVKEALKYKVAMLTVHTLAGPTALREVAEVCRRSSTKVLGVTLLTSIRPHFLRGLKIKRSLSEEALYLARMAKRCGLDGAVCSVGEASLIRRYIGKRFLIVTPGIRPFPVSGDDQKRTATVQEAISAGSNFLVIGRPILEAKDPLKAAEKIKLQISRR